MKSMLLMALLTVALAAQAQPPQLPQSPPGVADVLLVVSEQLKPLFVSEHNLAEMRDGFFGRKDIGDEESARVDDVLTITKGAAKAQAARVRDAMAAIRDTLKALPKLQALPQ